MASVYHSAPVSPKRRNIRLLHVHSAGDNDLSKAVSCDLSVIDLDGDHPPFATLTYVWKVDADEKLAIVSCGGQVLSLTKNGYDALRYLRKRLGAFTIWIDAICIDQANQEEKLSQVRLMGDIYSEAETVYVWLGSGNVACERALSFIERDKFQRYFRWNIESASYETSEPETRKAAFNFAFRRMGRIRVASSPGNSQGRVSFDDLTVLLDNLWITRMWTYQEILLASNPILVVGNFHLQWSLLERAIIFLQYSGTCRRSQPRLNQVLEAWIELILSRDQLAAVQAAGSNPISSEFSQPAADCSGLRPTPLLQYRNYVIELAEMITKVRPFSFSLAVFTSGFATFVAIAAGFGSLLSANSNGGFAHKSMVERLQPFLKASNHTIGPITACLQACQDLTAATCMSTCRHANDAVSQIVSARWGLEEPAANWKRVLFAIALPCIGGLLLCICALSIFVASFIGQRTAGPVYPPHDTTLNLVKGLCTRECSEIKDKALAMHAVLQRLSRFDKQLTDTTLPVRQIYGELSKDIIEVTKSLALLIPAAIQRFDDMPSWIPNWSAPMDPFWISPPLFEGHPADATPGSQSLFSWDHGDENVLTVKGISRSGKVFECYQFLETPAIYETKDDPKHFENLQMMLRFFNCVPISRQEDIIKILTMLLRTDSSGLSELKPQHLAQWVNFFTIFGENDPALIFSLFTREQCKDDRALIFSLLARRQFNVSIPVSKDVRASHFLLQLLMAANGSFMLANSSLKLAKGSFKLAKSSLMLAKTSSSKIWKTHIMICNALARGRKVLFSTSVKVHYNTSSGDPRKTAHHRRREEDVEGTSLSVVDKRGFQYDIHDIGIACDTVQPGDKIILVGGVRTPLVVRITPESDKLVSPALIPRLMAGHGWNGFLKSEDLAKFHFS